MNERFNDLAVRLDLATDETLERFRMTVPEDSIEIR